MSKIIIANWKMNKTIAEAEDYCNKIKDDIKKSENAIIILPSATSLQTVSNIIGRENCGAQNISKDESGAFTGHVSAEMVKELADYILLGHSERRSFETNEILNKKIKTALKTGLKVIYCIGEKEGESFNMLETQLKEGLEDIKENLIIAYEPVWAIGSGKTPTIEEIDETIKKIKIFYNLPVLYGGSVSPENAKEILSVCDGVLVGSASLDVESFVNICD